MNHEEKILEILGQMQGQMNRMEARLDRIEVRLDRLEARMDSLESRVDSLEAKQEQTQATIADMQTTLTRVAVTQENVVLPQLKTLAEGHVNLLETLASNSRVEALEEEQSVIRSAVKTLARDVDALKNAR